MDILTLTLPLGLIAYKGLLSAEAIILSVQCVHWILPHLTHIFIYVLHSIVSNT